VFPYSYALEKLSNAVRILATGPGDVRSRLLDATLEFHTLQPKDLPPDLQADYQWVLNQLTKHEPDYKSEGTLQATLRHMINRTGSRIATRLCDLQFHLERDYEEWERNLQASHR
jgi:hypothetical protein